MKAQVPRKSEKPRRAILTNHRKIGDTQKVMSPSHFPLPPPNPEFAKTLYNPPQYNIKGIGMNNFGELNVLSEEKVKFS